MKNILEQILQQAITSHREGKIEDAEALYIKILKNNSKHPLASYNLGVVELSRKNIETSLSLFRTAVEEDPYNEKFQKTYIATLINVKQFIEAEKFLKKIINNKPTLQNLTIC